jgi:hypothetical protein
LSHPDIYDKSFEFGSSEDFSLTSFDFGINIGDRLRHRTLLNGG